MKTTKEIELDPVEKVEKERGEKLVKILGLKKDPIHPDRYILHEGYGNKTAVGVYRVIQAEIWAAESAIRETVQKTLT